VVHRRSDWDEQNLARSHYADRKGTKITIGAYPLFIGKWPSAFDATAMRPQWQLGMMIWLIASN
jgi:hypothetical protein